MRTKKYANVLPIAAPAVGMKVLLVPGPGEGVVISEVSTLGMNIGKIGKCKWIMHSTPVYAVEDCQKAIQSYKARILEQKRLITESKPMVRVAALMSDGVGVVRTVADVANDLGIEHWLVAVLLGRLERRGTITSMQPAKRYRLRLETTLDTAAPARKDANG